MGNHDSYSDDFVLRNLFLAAFALASTLIRACFARDTTLSGTHSLRNFKYLWLDFLGGEGT
jgi:hypothetical protein